MPVPGEVAYWQAIYGQGIPPWDKGEPSPPLVRAVRAADLPCRTRALVPGCGFGHEALFLASEGFRVTAVDFAPAAIEGLKARNSDLPIEVLQQDIFTLGNDFHGQFDLVVEHTCFSAILPAMRDEYVRVMADVLVEGGCFLGMFLDFVDDDGDGPPFTTTRMDIERVFSASFEILDVERPADSFPGRRGEEWLVQMRRRRELPFTAKSKQREKER